VARSSRFPLASARGVPQPSSSFSCDMQPRFLLRIQLRLFGFQPLGFSCHAFSASASASVVYTSLHRLSDSTNQRDLTAEEVSCTAHDRPPSRRCSR
jgi:hypothetical protein